MKMFAGGPEPTLPPSISVVIPVLHESGGINRLLAHLTRLPCAGNLEIIVVDGAPSAETIEAIRDPRVRKVRSGRGRGIQMNAGAREASGDILLFLHADTRLPPSGPADIARAMRSSSAVGGAFSLSIDSRCPCYRVIETTATLRSRITRVPYGDQAIFIRRGYFLRIGGFAAFPILEDVELMRRIKKTGERIVLLSPRVRTSARRWERTGIFRNTLRNWLILILFRMGVPAERLDRFYR
ncbi:TIGR04283 family arsenosugar biosynthesis glycosyltransferase [Desulfococcus sp.]|uniref:TIGR04283 family arsenosugar biosynthesis glycosyltransferase n=1 Tax=Desulfococcus sp. TaxID=2025834 RepID=UPI0035935EB4